MMPKLFTVEEANARLPELEGHFRELDEPRRALQRVRDKLKILEAVWGEAVYKEENPDHGEWVELQAEFERQSQRLKEEVRAINRLGCLVKDVGLGLVDFLSLRGSRPVFLCWKRGEPAILYWHDLEAGYAGRQPLLGREVEQDERAH